MLYFSHDYPNRILTSGLNSWFCPWPVPSYWDQFHENVHILLPQYWSIEICAEILRFCLIVKRKNDNFVTRTICFKWNKLCKDYLSYNSLFRVPRLCVIYCSAGWLGMGMILVCRITIYFPITQLFLPQGLGPMWASSQQRQRLPSTWWSWVNC